MTTLGLPLTLTLHRLRWFHLPAGVLIALLQRSPVLRVVVSADLAYASGAGAVLKSAFASAVALGVVDTLAGATQLTANPGSPAPATVGVPFQAALAVTGAPLVAASYEVTGALPPGLAIAGLSGDLVNGSTVSISGTPTASGSFTLAIRAWNSPNKGGLGGTPTFDYTIAVAGGAQAAPSFTTQPQSQSAPVGGTVTLTVAAGGSPAPTLQWRRYGVPLAGQTAATLTLANLGSAQAGVYDVVATNSGGTTVSAPAVVGVAISGKVSGAASEVGANIQHPNGNIYDQLLLEGAAATLTADPGQVTRISFIDLTDDIVQVEFTGAGSLTVLLDEATPPAPPAKYNQAVNYVKGHPSIIITGATEQTHVSIFSVGRVNAVNQALFRDDVTYDGFADVGLVAISSANGRFGGMRAGNGSFFGTRGRVGVHAPGVTFEGPVLVSDLNAFDDATPVLELGAASDTRVTGGDFTQTNGRAVQVSGVSQLRFVAGITSHDGALPAQPNRARFEQNGTDITVQIVVNPTP